MAEPEVIIEGLDVIDVVRYITKKKDKFIAIVLAELEETFDRDSDEYKFVRKVFLDAFNDYTRSLMRTIFGNIEGLIMK
jgi:hypothetical protein